MSSRSPVLHIFVADQRRNTNNGVSMVSTHADTKHRNAGVLAPREQEKHRRRRKKLLLKHASSFVYIDLCWCVFTLKVC